VSKFIGKFRKDRDFEEDWNFSRKEKDQKKKSRVKKSSFYELDGYYPDEFQKTKKKQKYYS
jgi:hypothetical protein